MAGEDLLQRIDERTKFIAERMEEIGEHLSKLDKAVFIGNGSKPLLERVGTLETLNSSFAAQCAQCKAIILAPKDPTLETLAETLIRQQGDAIKANGEVKKTEVEIEKTKVEGQTLISSKRWEFWLLIATSAVGWVTAIIEFATRKP